MKKQNDLFSLECRVASLESAISDAMFILSEIDGNDDEDSTSGLLARCAYARLQQLIREKS